MLILNVYLGVSIFNIVMVNKKIVPEIIRYIEDSGYEINDDKANKSIKLALYIISLIPLYHIIAIPSTIRRIDTLSEIIFKLLLEKDCIELSKTDDIEEVKEEVKEEIKDNKKNNEITVEYWKSLSVEERKKLVDDTLQQDKIKVKTLGGK